jgi:hypothetical protein
MTDIAEAEVVVEVMAAGSMAENAVIVINTTLEIAYS